jgi:pimeloyl-ACP methyl ester carboxylesterase
MIKTIKWLLIAILLIAFLLVAALGIGSRLALDTDFLYSRDVANLPLFEAGSSDGIVRIKVGGEEFRARIAGFDQDSERPVVLLLHGFPVTSAMWLPLIEPLRAQGYRVLAFDQRGYSPGARPDAAQDYVISKLTADVIAVADTMGIDRFHLVGHDWGAVVGWSVVMNHPDRVQSWSALSIAHPTAFGEAIQNDPDQKARSRYFFVFVTPLLPEALFSFNDFAMLKAMYGPKSSTQVDEYIKLFSEPGALTAALNWYRAMAVSQTQASPVAQDITTPTLFIWGNNDPAVGRGATEAQLRFMKGPYRNIELEAGHWLVTDQPEAVTAAIVEHLAEFN